MLKYFKPYKIDSEKIRLGRNSDGGYVIPKLLAEKCNILVTYGYGGDKNFEDDFIQKYDKPNYIFDHTVNQEKWSHGDQYFYPEGLGNVNNFVEESNKLISELYEKKQLAEDSLKSYENTKDKKFLRKAKRFLQESFDLSNRVLNCISLKTPLEHYSEFKMEGEIFLKIDTEGAEYDYFMNENIDSLSSITTGIVLEVHWLEQEKYQQQFVQIMEKINRHFVLVHIHGNNWGGDFIYEGHKIPKVAEFTFINKKHISSWELDAQDYPIKDIDYPNNTGLPECDLSFIKKI